MREIADGCLIRGCVAEAYSVCFTINAGEVVSYHRNFSSQQD